MENKIIFVCGPICSGKSTIAKNLAEKLQYNFLEVSDVVKSLLKEHQRSLLSGHPELVSTLLETIQIAAAQSEGLVVSGARQLQLLQAFPKAELHWIEVSEEERLRRYMARQDSKDELTEEAFRKAQERDNQLGLQKIKEYINGMLHNPTK